MAINRHPVCTVDQWIVCNSSVCMHVYLNNLRTNTCVLVLVGVVHAFGPVIHVQQKSDLRNWRIKKDGNAFVKRAWRSTGMVVSQEQPSVFLVLLATAPLSWTHRPSHGLHGTEAVFGLSVYTSFLHQSPRSFFLTLVTIFWQWDR